MNCMEITQSLERKRDDFLNTMADESTEIYMNINHSELQLEIANLWDLARSKVQQTTCILRYEFDITE